MKVSLAKRLTTIAVGALGLAASAAMAAPGSADLSVELQGAGKKGAPLSAQVAVKVQNAKQVQLLVSNSSESVNPPAKKLAKLLKLLLPKLETPRLKRVGFNLADDIPFQCLEVVGNSSWKLAKVPKPFCWGGGFGASSGKPGKGEGAFDVELRAQPKLKGGLLPGESDVVTLRVKPSCKSESFSAASFVGAETSLSSGVGAQWAARFVGGGAGGCAQGGVDAPPPACEAEFWWGELVAVTADLNANPSNFLAKDARAGAVVFQFNGDLGFDPTGATTDAPFSAAQATLTNGANQLLEQWQVNRRWPGGNGCGVAPAGYPRCWVKASDYADGIVRIDLPTFAVDSNQAFDDSGLRPTVSAEVHLDHSDQNEDGILEDNSHQTLVIRWHAPLGIDSARLLLRGRYDDEGNGLNADDPSIFLFTRNVPGYPNGQYEGVQIIEETEFDLVLAINVEAGVQGTCLGYEALPE